MRALARCTAQHGARPALGRLDRRSRKLVAVAALVSLGAADDAKRETSVPALEPERIDVVYSRLARQGRTLEALLEIVQKLETIAEHPAAAAALLSDEGEPTDRLRKALDEVASIRARSVAIPAAPVAVAAAEGPFDDLRPKVLYAQVRDGDARVVVSVRGTRFVAIPGGTIRVGSDTIRVAAVRRRADAGVEVELRVNGGPPLVRRAGG